jgi:hypothetical protein
MSKLYIKKEEIFPLITFKITLLKSPDLYSLCSIADSTSDEVVTVHVTCGGLKKLIAGQKSEIETKVRKLLFAENVSIGVQCNRNWEDWVDIGSIQKQT